MQKLTDKEFEEIVRKAAEEKSPSILPNASPERAVIVLSNIFKTSEESIKIFANQFESEICEDKRYIEELENVINRGNISIDILFSNSPKLQSKAYQLLQNADHNHKKSINLKKLTDNARNYINSLRVNHGRPFHFAVADHRMYRFETDVKDNHAYFSFFDKDTANNLERMFINTWNLSQELQ